MTRWLRAWRINRIRRQREFNEWLAAERDAAWHRENVMWPELEANAPLESKLRAYGSLGIKLP